MINETVTKKASGVETSDFMSQVEAERVGVGVSVGRVASLGNYESARVTISIKAYYASHSEEKSHESLCDFISEHLEREIAKISDKSRDSAPVSYVEPMSASVKVDYGLTLRGKRRYESNRVDVSVERFVAEGQSLAAVLLKAQEDACNRLQARVDLL